jgi:hypothetical protein
MILNYHIHQQLKKLKCCDKIDHNWSLKNLYLSQVLVPIILNYLQPEFLTANLNSLWVLPIDMIQTLISDYQGIEFLLQVDMIDIRVCKDLIIQFVSNMRERITFRLQGLVTTNQTQVVKMNHSLSLHFIILFRNQQKQV